jgi:hypothetical protein
VASSSAETLAARAGGVGRSGLLIAALRVITAIDLALFAWYLKASIIREPFWDMYSWVLHYLDYRRDGGWWAYLWAPHDVHRPVWIRLLTAFDIEVFSGTSYPFIVFATACHLVTAWLLWRESRRGVHGRSGEVLGYMVLMLLLTSVAAVNCAVPLTNGYVHVLSAIVLAIVLFDGEGEVRAPGRSAIWRRSAAILAGVSAPLASAVGWAIWPILLWVAWRGNTGRMWITLVGIIGAAFAAIYNYGLTITLGDSPTPAAGLANDLLARANYLVTYLGLPWTRAAALAVPGRIVGALLLAAGVWVVVRRGLLRPPAGRLERIAVALVMFSLASALLASAGRAGVTGRTDVLVPVRYAVLVTPLHVGLLWIVWPVLGRLWDKERHRIAVSLAVAGACVLLLVQQIAAGQMAAAQTARMRATIDRFLAAETDSEMTSVIYIDLDQARREHETIRRAGLYQDLR